MFFNRLKITVCVFKNQIVQNSKIGLFFEKPTNKALFCGLTTEMVSKYI